MLTWCRANAERGERVLTAATAEGKQPSRDSSANKQATHGAIAAAGASANVLCRLTCVPVVMAFQTLFLRPAVNLESFCLG